MAVAGVTLALVTGAGCLPDACLLGGSLFSGEAAPGLGPAADFPFLARQEREAKEGAGTPASAHFAQALRLRIPRTTTVSSSTVTVRDTDRARAPQLASHRPRLPPRRPDESRDPPSRWAPACAGVTGGASEQSEQCPQCPRQAGKRSEAADQAGQGPTVPVGTGLRQRDRGGERAKRATPPIACDRQASGAKPQIKPHASPAWPGDPWLPLGGTGAKAP